MPMPPILWQRQLILSKAHEVFRLYPLKVSFSKRRTIHADLLLRWMKTDFQEKHIAPCSEYQIVIARIEPGQKSRPHLHEIGASSFVGLMGWDLPIFEPKDLVYRFGRLDHRDTTLDTLILEGENPVHENSVQHILPYAVHQFENKGTVPAHILIVTHPIIYVVEGKEDIFFCPEFS